MHFELVPDCTPITTANNTNGEKKEVVGEEREESSRKLLMPVLNCAGSNKQKGERGGERETTKADGMGQCTSEVDSSQLYRAHLLLVAVHHVATHEIRARKQKN